MEIADAIPGVPEPFEQDLMVGYAETIKIFLKAFTTGRPHHAWLLSGPNSIGKATLAFRLARAILDDPGQSEKLFSLEDLASASDRSNITFRKVASGAHPNLFHLRRTQDPRTKKFRTQITVDDVRAMSKFLTSTAGQPGWRVVVIDTIGEFNGNAQNSLLKILEEPPYKTLFFVINNQKQKLLETIKSRCLEIRLNPLSQTELLSVLTHLKISIDNSTAHTEAAYALGGVRGVINRSSSLFEEFTELLKIDKQRNYRAVEAFVGKFFDPQNETTWLILQDQIMATIHAKALQDPPSEDIASLLDLWNTFQRRFHNADTYNLDRRQVLASTIFDLQEITSA